MMNSSFICPKLLAQSGKHSLTIPTEGRLDGIHMARFENHTSPRSNGHRYTKIYAEAL